MSRDFLKAQIVDALRRVSVRPLSVAGLSLHVRGLTGAERIELQQMAAESQKAGKPIADFPIAALGLCDEAGARLFDDPNEIAELDGAVLAVIAKAVLDASGLGEKAQESAEKN